MLCAGHPEGVSGGGAGVEAWWDVYEQAQAAGEHAGDVEADPYGYVVQEEYYRQGPLPESAPSLHREAGTLEFVHRWGDMLGGLCRAGFSIEDIMEPRYTEKDAVHGSFAHRSAFIPPYIEIKARRLANELVSGPKIWTPLGG